MPISKFSEYYLNSLVKDPANDYDFDDSDKWFDEHTAITPKGSFVIGIKEEQNFLSHRHFLDTSILPLILDVVKKNIDKHIVFLTTETESEKYIFDILLKKFPKIQIKIYKENLISEIQKVELENKIVITVPNSSEVFSKKNVIEYI